MNTRNTGYDAWLSQEVRDALDDPRPCIPHTEVMAQAQACIDAKRKDFERLSEGQDSP